ncbi:hypothetical protein DXV75_09005 [Alteromonas aestuariivivens]|uniref:Uncharacterized protein n=1 Tax=Alteromonas aestuariivivens TaxID=1938339 RepID=A0A3D8M744_9ALTE|nr:hypothetical protein [Alteromonas aestuariivivens]RDV25433.1 hypothetical protein DXV75_09005 [Alteromonas aestuariivivens]
MISLFIIRAGLPVVPASVAMLGVAFMGGIFLADYTSVAVSYLHSFAHMLQYQVESLVWYIAGPDALVKKIELTNDAGEVIKTYESAEQFYLETGGISHTSYPTVLAQVIDGICDLLRIPNTSNANVITFMVAYYIFEMVLLFKILGRIAASGKKMPKIKQRFEV